ncbi:MAG: hypothetical protein ACI8RD_001970 [Bacillariaceae sp.]|jgi:hypothetical protein
MDRKEGVKEQMRNRRQNPLILYLSTQHAHHSKKEKGGTNLDC